MKRQITIMILFSLLIISIGNIYSQGVSFDATIENQSVVGTDFYFDIFLATTGINDLYLGNSQFILTFNSGAFTGPTISKEASSNWNLISSDLTSVGANYRNNTAVTISENQIKISINSPTPSDQEGFDASVAKIDNQVSTHCVGRYKISHISNPSANMDLQWVSLAGIDPHSKVSTIKPSDPWDAGEASGTWEDIPTQPLPVELVSFTAKQEGEKINISWQTKTEVNNYGFEVERSINNKDWTKIGFVEGSGNSNSTKNYLFVDNNPKGGSRFNYKLKQIDTDGKYTYSDIEEVEYKPTKLELYQNYPNPFNPTTKIDFSLPQTNYVTLKVFNTLGEEVATLVNRSMEAGAYTFNYNANGLSNGIYIYQLRTNNVTLNKKMVLMK